MYFSDEGIPLHIFSVGTFAAANRCQAQKQFIEARRTLDLLLSTPSTQAEIFEIFEK